MLRKFLSTVFILLLLSSPILAKDLDCSHDKTTFSCVEYIKNYDADTITFNIPNTHPLIGEKISVRVYGIDTPELKTRNVCEKKQGIIARDYVTTILEKAKRIDLKNLKRDKYFRILADVIVDGVSIGDLLLKNGHAYQYYGDTKQKIDWCKQVRNVASKK